MVFSVSTIIVAPILALCSYGVMKHLSSVHLVVFDTFRTLIIWVFSLAVSWQLFNPLQLVGFLVMILGVMVFNDILFGMYIWYYFKYLTKTIEHFFLQVHSSKKAWSLTRVILSMDKCIVMMFQWNKCRM